MKLKKSRLIITVIIVNIIVVLGTLFTITALEATDYVEYISSDLDLEMELLNKNHFGWPYEGIMSQKTPYINDVLNNDYKAELVATYTYLAKWWTNRYSRSCYGVAYDEKGNIIAESGNYGIFSFRENGIDSDVEYCRIFDVDKFLSQEQLSDIKEYLIQNDFLGDGWFNFYTNGAMIGKMDDYYVYPEYIVHDSIIRDKSIEDIKEIIENENNEENNKYGYIINNTYDYANPNSLKTVSTYYRHQKYCEIIDVELSFLYDIENDKYYKEAKSNVEKFIQKESSDLSFEKKSIFDYEKIYSRQRIVSGHTITEYISFDVNPFVIAIAYCTGTDSYLYALIFIFVINLLVFIAVKLYVREKEKYVEYTKKIFYELTDKLKNPLANIKKLHESIEGEKTDSKASRELIDREIAVMNGRITDMLNLSKMEVGILNIDVDEVELGYLVDAIVEKKRIETKSEMICDIDTEIAINGDLKILARCIKVLVEHTISRTDNMEKIYVTLKKQGDTAYFEVTNKKEMVMSGTNIINKVSTDMSSIKKMDKDGYELILVKGYLNLHNAQYDWTNDEGYVRYWFKVPYNLSKREVNVDKSNDIKKIYGVIAHEIKTPLNVIKLHNEALMEGIMSEKEAKRYNEIISNQIDIISTQLEEVINTNKLEAGNLKLSLEEVDIVKVVNDAMTNYKLLIEDKALNIDMDMPEKFIIKADKSGMHNIVSNYIANAIKYSKMGGHIRISVKQNKGDMMFAIINSNPVVSNVVEGDNKNIINRIERNGLGLLIAKSYLKLHKAKFGNDILGNAVQYWFKLRVR